VVGKYGELVSIYSDILTKMKDKRTNPSVDHSALDARVAENAKIVFNSLAGVFKDQLNRFIEGTEKDPNAPFRKLYSVFQTATSLNDVTVDKLEAALSSTPAGGSRRATRKNPVRFVRDHAPNVSAKDLRKLRTLSRRHKLVIPSQTTANSWKTFDPSNLPEKVVRIVVDGGEMTHTFEFGINDGRKRN